MSSSPRAHLYPTPLSQSRSLTQTESRLPTPSSSKSSRRIDSSTASVSPLRLAARPVRCSLTLRSYIQDRPCSMFPVVEQGVILVFEAASPCSSHFMLSAPRICGRWNGRSANAPTLDNVPGDLEVSLDLSGPLLDSLPARCDGVSAASWPPYNLAGFLRRQSPIFSPLVSLRSCDRHFRA